MTTDYDIIAKQYKKSKELPFRLHVEAYTFFNLLGNIAGKSLLDLACGEGFYTRQLQLQGTAPVVGVDNSEKMIELARQQEALKPQGIKYIIADVQELGVIGSFDLVVAAYLLNYAQTKEQLLLMCQTIYNNLKPGGRFVTVNDNNEQPPNSFLATAKYGFIKSISEPLAEGTPIKFTFFVDGEEFSFDNYYLSRDTYEWAFQTAGFKQVRWQKPLLSPDALKQESQEFWQDFLNYPPLVGIECVK